MKKISVKLEAHGLWFYWTEKSFLDNKGGPILCTNEDIDFTISIDGILCSKYCTQVDTKAYYRDHIENIKGDYGKRLEKRIPNFIDNELNDIVFGIPMKDLVNCNERLLGFCYDSPDDSDKYETDLPDAPVNEKGMKPSYIMIFSPAEVLNKKEVELSIKFYIEKLFGLGDDLEFSFEWINEPSEKELRKCLDDEIEFVNRMGK